MAEELGGGGVLSLLGGPFLAESVNMCQHENLEPKHGLLFFRVKIGKHISGDTGTPGMCGDSLYRKPGQTRRICHHIPSPASLLVCFMGAGGEGGEEAGAQISSFTLPSPTPPPPSTHPSHNQNPVLRWSTLSHVKNYGGGRSYLRLGSSLIHLHLPSHQPTWKCKNALSKRKVVFLQRPVVCAPNHVSWWEGTQVLIVALRVSSPGSAEVQDALLGRLPPRLRGEALRVPILPAEIGRPPCRFLAMSFNREPPPK